MTTYYYKARGRDKNGNVAGEYYMATNSPIDTDVDTMFEQITKASYEKAMEDNKKEVVENE